MTEAELLFTDLLKCNRIDLYSRRPGVLGKSQLRLISSALKRRAKGEPLQYILGKQEFMGFEFKVNPGVVIPRPETELLVEAIIKLANRLSHIANRRRILEIGTGSGCIAVSLAKLLPQVAITATDISEKALEVAKNNASLHYVDKRIEFIQSDLFATCDMRHATCDIIVSNPPYIVSGEIDNLASEIGYEPRIGLDGGRDGLDFYRRIIAGSLKHLQPGGFLALEIGLNQRRPVESILKKRKDFSVYRIIRDYNNIERIIIAQKVK